MNRSVKVIVYESITALLTAWALLRCAALASADQLAAQGGLRTAEMTLLILACALIGGAVYLKRAHARKTPDLRPDVWFGLGIGAVLLVLWFVSFWMFGGLSGVTEAAGIRARNFQIVCMSALPLPFAVRAAVLAFFSKDEHAARRVILCAVAGAVLLVYGCLLVFGGLMNTLPVPATRP